MSKMWCCRARWMNTHLHKSVLWFTWTTFTSSRTWLTTANFWNNCKSHSNSDITMSAILTTDWTGFPRWRKRRLATRTFWICCDSYKSCAIYPSLLIWRAKCCSLSTSNDITVLDSDTKLTVFQQHVNEQRNLWGPSKSTHKRRRQNAFNCRWSDLFHHRTRLVLAARVHFEPREQRNVQTAHQSAHSRRRGRTQEHRDWCHSILARHWEQRVWPEELQRKYLTIRPPIVSATNNGGCHRNQQKMRCKRTTLSICSTLATSKLFSSLSSAKFPRVSTTLRKVLVRN